MTRKSIYRGWRALPADVHEGDVTVRGPAPRVQHVARSPKDWTALRKARPAEQLLPRTVDWILGLPPGLRPHLLARSYARIANQLCVAWTERTSCRAYFDDLLTDRRGGRRGFPLGVHQELLALRRHYGRQCGERDDGWQDAERRAMRVV
jgi:hypothetical protein